MQFYFIRHAQSANNALWVATGSNEGRSADPEITPLGVQQANRLAQFLAQKEFPQPTTDWDPHNRQGFHLTHLYTSLMLRAVMTGVILSRVLGLPLVAWKDVHESGGIYLDDPVSGEPIGLPGKNRAYFTEHFPELRLPDDLGEEGWWNRPFEPDEERPARAQRFLDELLQRHGGSEDRVAVISHGGFYNRMMNTLLRMSSRDGLWFTMNNCAITRIDFDDDGASLIYMNRADFLPDEWLT